MAIAIAVGVVASSAAAGASAPPGDLSLALAALLGALQGATEFLPVSSSGHLALAQQVFGVDPESAGHRFNIAVHAGTLLAVIWVYRRDVVALLSAALRPHRAGEPRDWIVAMMVATLPLALALSPGIKAAIIAVEGQPRLVGVGLWITAAVLLVGFRRSEAPPVEPDRRAPRLLAALGIGVAQLFAILPGVSRSGSTIAAGLLFGVDRERAARFSFLISIPAIMGATLLEVLELQGTAASVIDPLPYAVGFVTAMLVGFVCLRWLLVIVRGGNIIGFVAYLVVAGGIAVALG